MKSLLTALAALALAACASQGPTTTASDAPRKQMEDKEYRTGSRIPVRDSVSSSPTGVASPSAMNPTLPPKM